MKRALLTTVLALACAMALAWNAAALRLLAENPRRSDFDQFVLSAQAFLDGRDLYLPGGLTAANARPLGGLVNMNPPNFALMLVPLALLPRAWAFSIWMFGSVLAMGVSYLLIAREIAPADAAGRPRVWTVVRLLAVLLATLAFAGTRAFFLTGQLSLLLMLAVTLAWRDARHARWNRAAVVLGVCLSVKPFFLIFVPYLVISRRVQPALLILATAAACMALGLAICGPAAYVSWYFVMHSFTSRSALGLNASIQGLFQRLFSPSPFYVPLLISSVLLRSWVIVAAAVGVATLAAILRGVQRTPRSVDYAFALLLTGAQLISPLGWVYYMVLPIGPVAALVAADRRAHLRIAPDWWRGALVAIAIAGFVVPLPARSVFGRSLLTTLTVGSVYFWAVLASWLWLLTARQPATTAPA